jgi:NAD(P)-dependent dehydrogenase (short-subunit alcohol dehydrogenase family)
LVTGSNRGIGKAIVEELLARGAKKVYATARNAAAVADLVKAGGGRVIALSLDITNDESVKAAATAAGDVTLLINNAGALAAGSQVTTDVKTLELNLDVNYYGTLRAVQAFAPVIERNGGGTIANVLSVVSFAGAPGFGAYSASKAAAHSLTQALRSELAPKGVKVLGVYPGPVDTDMAKALEGVEKATPASVAAEIADGIDAQADYILPDPMAKQAFSSYAADPRSLEAFFASFV